MIVAVLGLLANLMVFMVAAALVLGDAVKTNKATGTRANYVYNAPQPERASTEGPNVVSRDLPPIKALAKKEAAREEAKNWLRNDENLEFIVAEIEKPVDNNFQRNFVITADKLSSLSEEAKNQLVLLLMETLNQQITEATYSKDGNIYCYYYMG